MATQQRPLYAGGELARLIQPASIAIVGASPNEKSFANRTLQGLAGFPGRIELVNAKYPEIGGRACHPSISALTQVPDCVVIATARSSVEPLVQECADAGVGGVILYASGFAETGKPQDVQAQQRLASIARSAGMRLLGPNCIGLVNAARQSSITFMGELDIGKPNGPAVGIVSQSGAIGLGLAQGSRHGAQISHVLNAGNSCDVDVADLVAYLASDLDCQAIACVFEGLAQPERFMQAAELAAAADKPLVVYKLATSAKGASAAMSHTGSMAGMDAAYRAAFERHGVVVVDQLEALMETAAFFAKAGRPSAKGVAVVAASGGMAIIAADAAEAHGVHLPAPDANVAAVLNRHVPDFGVAGNPCDVTAQVANNPESLTACTQAFLASPDIGALVLPIHYAYEASKNRVALAQNLALQHGKPTCIVWANGWLDGPGAVDAERSAQVAMFRSMDRCLKTLAIWHRREVWRAGGPRVAQRASPAEARTRASALLAERQHAMLTEHEAKRVLAAYGLCVTRDIRVQTVEQAVAAASSLGYPVALKAESPDIPHKTDAGVLRLNLQNEAQLREAFDAIMAKIVAIDPMPRLNGLLVQPMLLSGVEIMVGAKVDPLFGPLVLVSLGGVLVELLKDSAVELAPVTRPEALAMLKRLKGRAVLEGFRGAPAVNLNALADAICLISEFAADQREHFTELDVNPLICTANGVVAVDALISTSEQP